MKKIHQKSGAKPVDKAALIEQLSEAEEALKKATGNEVDAIIHSGGQPYMLNTAREALHESQIALQTSEKRFRALIENSSEIISLIDRKGVITYISSSISKVLGYTPEERMGVSIFKNIHPEDLPRLRVAFKRLVRQPGYVTNALLRCRHKNEQWRWMEGHATNLLEDPDIQAIVINFRDVTERTEYETEIQKKSHDLNERIKELKCINQITDILGKTDTKVEDLLQEIVDIIPPAFQFPEVAGAKIELYDKKITTGNYLETPWALKKDIHVHGKNIGEVQICYLEKKPDNDEGSFLYEERNLINEIAYKLGQVFERKQMQDKLADNEQSLSNLIINLPGMVYRCLNDRNWTIQFISPGSFHLTGYTPEQFTSNKIHYNDVIHPDDRGKVWERVQRALDIQERYQIEYRIQAADGEVRWVWEQGCGTFGDEGEILYLEGFVTDITDRKYAEKDLLESERFATASLDGLSANIAILDENGTILRVNNAWRKFAAENSSNITSLCEGVNYLAACDAATGAEESMAKDFANGFRAVLAGKQEEFLLEYPCHSPDILRWFNGRITSFPGEGPKRIIVANENITQRKLAEVSLQNSEQRFSHFMKNLPGVAFIKDSTGHYQFVSDIWKEFFGNDPADVIGMTDDELWPPDVAKKLREIDQAIIEKGKPLQIVEMVPTIRGKTFWLTSKFPIPDHNGNTKMLGAVAIDITERREAEEKLHNEVNFSNALLNSLPGIVYCYDQNLKFLRWNKNFERVLGYSSEEIAGMSPLDFFKGPDRELMSERISEVFAFGTSDADAGIVTRDNRKIPYYFTGNRIEIDGVNCLVGVGIDMTELKQAENELKRNEIALRTSEAQLFNALKLARAAHWEYDVASNKFTFNDLFYAIFHTTAEEVGGYTMSPDEYARRFVYPDDIYMVSEEVRAAIETTDPDFTKQLEHRILYSDGGIGYLAVRILVVKDERGRTIRTYGVNQDVTVRKRTEKALHESEEKLRLFIKYAPSAIAMFDLNMRYLAFSNRWLVDYRLGEQDLTGCSHYEIFPGIPDRWKKIHQRCLTGAIERCEEDQFVRADGSVDWVRWEIHPWRTDIGDIGGIIIFSEVITVRKQAEQQLQLQSAALHASANAIKITDLYGRILWINQAFTNLTGYKSEEVIGKNPRLFLKSSKHDRAFYKNLWDTILAGNVWRSEIVNCRKDGSLYTEDQTISPVKNDHGEITHFISIMQNITERKQAEEALLKNQRNLLKAQKLARLGNWEWYPQDNYVTGSEELFRIFAIEPQQERYPLQEFLDRIHPDDQESVNQSIQDVLSGARNDLNLEYRVVYPDGEIRHVIHQGESVFTAQNKLSHLFGVVQDITEQILAEQTLRKSEFNLFEAQRIARLGSWELDLASGHLHWTDEVYKIFNLGKEEFDNTYEGFISHVHPDDRDYIEKIQELALAGKNEYNVEHRIVWQDGTIRWVNEIGEAEGDKNGQPQRFIGTVLDITERKEAEIALQNREELLRTVGTVAKVAGWELDVRTGECVCTEEVAHINETDEFGTEAGLEYYEGESRRKIRNALDDAIQHGKPFDLELEMVTAKGNHKWIRTIAQAVMEDGEVIKLIGSFQDITRQHVLEEQLHQSQRLEAIGQLTGGVAHDFNNLLTVILGNSELLTDRLASNNKLQPLAQMIGSAAKRGAELTQRLLAFARKQTLEPHAININRLLLDMQKLLQTTLDEQIDILFKLQKDLWTTLIDPGQLENALLNLCINARDAMPKGGVLTLETGNNDLDHGYANRNVEIEPGQYIVISVTDTGDGIAQEHLTQIFEPFYTTKEKGKGTGLGLSMVYGFIHQSGGYIDVYSEPGQGTTVKMYLPRVTSDIKAIEEDSEDVPVTGGSETILLVEDDPLVRQYAQNQLLSLGYRVLTAENGPQALAIIRENNDIDLLFTDVVMPSGMNGPKLAELALQERPELKVLFTSGYTRDAFSHAGRLEEGVQLLNKPYGRAELARKIRDVLDNDTGS